MSYLPSRRDFLRRAALAPAALAYLANSAQASKSRAGLKFGLIADIHQDIMHDGVERVKAFVAAMEKIKPDFVLQLGDFCQPHARNRPFLESWNKFPGPKYHVLGNHDMDGGYKPEQTVAYYGMTDKHYAFTAGAVRVIVLDGNEPGGKSKGYKRFVGPKQIAWFRDELAQTPGPVLIFVHQPIDSDKGDGQIENAATVRAAIEQSDAGKAGRIVAVFSGHLHTDYERVVNGIRYIEINSASYWWLNDPKAYREVYPPEVHKAHPYLNHVAPYRDALWAVVTLDFERHELIVEGRRSEWVGPDPWQRGVKVAGSKDEIHAVISDRKAKITAS